MGFRLSWLRSLELLVWKPQRHLKGNIRLESVFAVVFCACVKMIMDEVFIPDFFLWSRDSVTWEPCCTHLSLSESVRADLSLADAEIAAVEKMRLERDANKTDRYRKRKRAQNEKEYLKANLRQHQTWADKNRAKVNQIAAGVRQSAKDAGRFRCDICDKNFSGAYHLQQHRDTKSHKQKAATVARQQASKQARNENDLLIHTNKQASSSNISFSSEIASGENDPQSLTLYFTKDQYTLSCLCSVHTTAYTASNPCRVVVANYC
jgi:hypothetical protein